MKKATCIWDMVLAGKVFIDGREYKVSHKQDQNETIIKYLYSDDNYVCCGYIHAGSKRNFVIKHRSMGLDWESKVKYTSVEL